MFPLLFRVAMSKKPAAASSITSLHRVLLLPPSLKPSNRQCHLHKVSVSSTETIKPSSPTPAQIAAFKLSLIDNHAPPLYVPFIFFFPAPPDSRRSNSTSGDDRFETLKSSLAQTLTRFYPLAGRLSRTGDSNAAGSVPVVHCNDEGVPFSSASVDGDSSMDQLLRNRIELDSLQQFLPFPADMVYTPAALESAPQIAFRATAFPCGGLAIGVCMLHKIIDAATFADFMKLWSAVARSDEKTATAAVGGSAYAHDRAARSLMPARPEDVAAAAEDFVEKEGKILTRRFVFDEEAIHALKAKAKSDRVSDPTRTEAVAGFLWKSVISVSARALSPDGSKPRSMVSIAAMVVNLRLRMKEPWPHYSVGNIVWAVPSSYHNDHQHDTLDDDEDETKTLQELVGELRGSVAKLDQEFMRKIQGGDGRQEYLRNIEAAWKPAMAVDAVNKGTIVVPFRVSSAIGLRLYDVDFGWGKPAWVTMAQFSNPIINLVALLESPTGYGVEVWINMHEKEMSILEQEPEFVTYAKNNPPVLRDLFGSK